MANVHKQLHEKLCQQLEVIYGGLEQAIDHSILANELLALMGFEDELDEVQPFTNHWSEQDVVLITYGDSVIANDQKPLKTLKYFLDHYIGNCVNAVHILPFFPYSSDDGFAVIDYSSVNEALGEWQDIRDLARNRRIMADLVINHCSSRSAWFESFIAGKGVGHDYFYTASPEDDVSQVVRPRTSPLLKEVQTANGTRFVWCTFSEDQVDFDFRNPKVLKSFVSIIRHYLDSGISIFRLDAIAFLWKQPGTPSINLPQTHEVVRLLRTLIEHACQQAIVITETNIPNTQNLTYFGNANEAHAIYNFSLPPLLVNTLITGNCLYLKRWLMSMPPAQQGTCYFNFIASHDGIGLRPTEGLLTGVEIKQLITTMQRFGGKISWRTGDNGQQKAYEINIALYDAFKGTVAGEDQFNIERFLCAHAIMLALEGIPGIYIHSMLATGNDYEKLRHSHHNRSINRHRWQLKQLSELLADHCSIHAQVLKQMQRLIAIRIKQPAFHPNATQFTLHLGLQLFGFWRQSQDRRQSIFCISNVTNKAINLPLSELNLIVTENWYELISEQPITDLTQAMELQPYQTVWITNSHPPV